MALSLHRVHPVRSVGAWVGVVVAHLIAVVGCYSPATLDCTVQCAAATDCTGGQICRGDGWCAMPDVETCDQGGSGSDANEDLTADANAALVDAVDPCPQACTNGTCQAGVCVIDCSADSSCPNDIYCAPNIPCKVVCGNNACAHKVFCGLASSCEVLCSGTTSCRDEIICNAGPCDVTCSGFRSCDKRIRCSSSCSCDVMCIGTESCHDPSECPASTCRVGNGCTSAPVGCNTCS